MLPIKRPWKSNYCRVWWEQVARNYSGLQHDKEQEIPVYFNNDRDTVQSRWYCLRLHTPNGGNCLFCVTRNQQADA